MNDDKFNEIKAKQAELLARLVTNIKANITDEEREARQAVVLADLQDWSNDLDQYAPDRKGDK